LYCLQHQLSAYFFAGDVAAKSELAALHAKIHAGGDDVVAAAIAGTSRQRISP
jgi:hypothetical protein